MTAISPPPRRQRERSVQTGDAPVADRSFWLADRTLHWLTWGALISIGIFLVWLLIRGHEIVHAIYGSSDNAAGPVIGQFFGERGSSAVVLGNYPWLESLYGELITKWLPSHRVVWELEPFLALAASIALVGWSIRRTVSKHAGLLVVLAMASPAPLVLWTLGSPILRLNTLAHGVLLAVFLISAPGLRDWGGPRRAAWAAGLAITLAPGVASDPVLMVISGTTPFIVATAAAWWLSILRRAEALISAGACVVGTAGGLLLIRLAAHDHITYRHENFPLADGSALFSNFRLLLEDVAQFAHGALGGPLKAIDAVEELVALSVMVGVPVLCVLAVRRRRLLVDPARPPQQRLLALFWVVVVGTSSIAFITSTAPVNTTSIRYVALLWPALLSLAAIVWLRRALPWLAVFAIACALLGSVQLARHEINRIATAVTPTGDEVAAVERFVDRHQLDHGYASYWVGAATTQLSDFNVRAYPLTECGYVGPGLCPPPYHTIATWYRPKAGVRTFYLRDDANTKPAIPPPPARWGPPLATAHFGDYLIYAYPYDIASVLAAGTKPPQASGVSGPRPGRAPRGRP